MALKITALSEEELVLALINKDVIALQVLYQDYATNLLGVITKIVKGEEANDVLQIVFIRIWQMADKYDPEKGRVFTWLLNIARNCAIDTLRSRSYKEAKMNFGMEDCEGFLEMRTDKSFNPDTIGLRNMVACLDPKWREVVELTFFKGYTHEEASKELNIPLGTLKTRIRYALSNLSRSFNEPQDLLMG